MAEPLFIGAGTRGAKLVGHEFQPYIDFHGKTCLEYVVDAAIEAETVGDIYIWGDRRTLERILAEHRKRYGFRLVIVAERENIVESFFTSYLRYLSSGSNTLRSLVSGWDSLKSVNWDQLHSHFVQDDFWNRQINVIVSDTPLISPYEIDYLIANKNRDADMVLGRTARKDYKAVLEELGETPDREKSVKNFYTYRTENRDVSLIVNSFMAGKPLKLNENIWNLTGNFYKNRTIIAGRKKNLRNIAQNLVYFTRLFFPKKSESEQQSYPDRLRAILYLINAYRAIVKSKSSSVYYRDLQKIYNSIHILVDLHIELGISHCFGSAFDIDTRYEVDFIRRNFFNLQNICRKYYRTHNRPQL